MISKNVIIPFDGNHASIPAGFTRETSLDGLFHKGAADATNPNTTGGNATHSHTSAAHSHTMANHTHTYTMNPAPQQVDDGSSTGTPNPSADEVHYHTGTSGAASGGTLNDAATIGSASNNPPYYEVIFIKASKISFVPPGALLYRNDTEEPTGFYFCDGDNGTPDLVGKYLRGAGTGANAGATGGSLVHTHSMNHTHSAVNHAHDAANSSSNTNGQTTSGDSAGSGAADTHYHLVSWFDTSVSAPAYSGTFDSGDVEPAHVKLRVNKNMSGVKKIGKKGDIALFLGNLADIPAGWVICDGDNDTPDLREKFVKIDETPGATGGSNTHQHTGVGSHSHTASTTHSHSASIGTGSDGYTPSGNGHSKSTQNHAHSMGSVSSETAAWNAATIDTNSVDNQPQHRTVAYIMLKSVAFGGAGVLAGLMSI